MKGVFILIGTMCCLLNTLAYSNDYAEIEHIHISRDDLILTDKGIYFIENGDLIEVSAIYSNAKGITIVPNRDQVLGFQTHCGNNHPIYHHRHEGGCGGCANWICLFRCKCHSPWAKS